MKKAAVLIGGLLWGDEDKGATTDWLARYLLSLGQSLTAVIRANGGSQPAHTVTTDDGRKHVFRQVTSASFVPGVLSYLSGYMLVDPIYLFDELLTLRKKNVPAISPRLMIDRRARIVTPLHIAANRLRERSRGDNRHGSCGQGIGEAQDDFLKFGNDLTLRVGELNDKEAVRKKLSRLFEQKNADLRDIISAFRSDPDAADEIKTFTDRSLIESYVEVYDALADYAGVVDEKWIKALLNKPGIIAFENSQGALLDPEYGFAPYVTHTKTTFINAETLLDSYGYDGQLIRLGLSRSYAHRHGEGPFPTFSGMLTTLLPDLNNPFNPWQKSFRVGYFDPIMLSYALKMVGGVDFLVIGHLDELEKMAEWKVADHYRISATPKSGLTDGNFDNPVRTLRFKSEIDPVYQAKLTEALKLAVPVYLTFSKAGGTKAFLEYVRGRFGIPIGLTAYGPTASNRVPSSDFGHLFL